MFDNERHGVGGFERKDTESTLHTYTHNFSIEETKRKNTMVTHSKDLNGGHHYTQSACRDVSGLGQTLQVNENGSAMRQLDILLSCCIEGLFALNVHPTTVEN